MNVNIVERPAEKIAYLSHLGSPDKVFETAARFIAWRKETGLSPVTKSRTYGIPFADPEQIPSDEFRFDIAGSIEKLYLKIVTAYRQVKFLRGVMQP